MKVYQTLDGSINRVFIPRGDYSIIITHLPGKPREWMWEVLSRDHLEEFSSGNCFNYEDAFETADLVVAALEGSL